MSRLLSFEITLTQKILVAVGATACLTAACGDDETSTGGGGSGGGTTSSTTSGQTTTSASTTTSSTTASTTASTGTGQGGGGGAGGGDGGGGGGVAVERCWPASLGDPPCPPLAEAGTVYPCTIDSEVVNEWVSGPDLVNGECCYQVEVGPPNDPTCAVIGRPLVVDGRPARAPIARGDQGWSASPSRPRVEGLDTKTRARLARAWADDASYEHASVASFAKLSLELLALGAPAELVRAAHEAALDEIRHAELGFALASAYAGEPVSPGPLAEAVRAPVARDLPALVAAAVREGCVGETLAALVASAQHDAATDEAVISSLAVVRADEARHAELAWKLVAWALRSGGADVRAAAEEAFAAAAADLASVRAEDTWSVHPHGRLSEREMLDVRRRGLELVVRPAMEALLAAEV